MTNEIKPEETVTHSPLGELVQRLVDTDDSRVLLFQRVVLGGVVLAHGAQKLLGWFGGYGFDATVRWFGEALHVPAPFAVLVILSDSLGSLALVFGLFSRFMALGTTLTMLGAILLFHAPNGFFMNWSGTNAGEGYELHLLALALSLPIVVRGAGAWSLDRRVAAWLRARTMQGSFFWGADFPAPPRV
jgi:putative oxidoreductase